MAPEVYPYREKSREVSAGARREDQQHQPGKVRSPAKCEPFRIDVVRKVCTTRPAWVVGSWNLRNCASRAKRNSSCWTHAQRRSISGSQQPINARCKNGRFPRIKLPASLFAGHCCYAGPPPFKKKTAPIGIKNKKCAQEGKQ